jgi:hypothetical protein
MRFSVRCGVGLALFLNLSVVASPQPSPPQGATQAVSFPADQSYVRVPFQFLANAVFVQAKVNGKGPYLFYVDTGASDAIIASEEAATFGLHAKSTDTSMGAGSDSYEVGRVAGAVEFTLPGGLVVSTDRAVTISMAGTWPLIGQRVYGNIGREILRHFVVEFDYEKKTITFFDPAKFHYAGKAPRFPSPVRGQIVVKGGGPVSSDFSIDTGAGGTIVTAPLVADDHLIDKVTQKVPSPSHGIGNGVSDDVVGRIGELRLGRYSIHQPLVALSQDTEGSLAHDAFVNLGGNILSRFTITIDYFHHEVFLEPNSHFPEPFESDASGLVLEAKGSDFRIFTVQGIVQGSPADKAGIQTGDIVAGVDGVAATRYALWELQNLLKSSGAERSLAIKRNGKMLTIRIKLQALA